MAEDADVWPVVLYSVFSVLVLLSNIIVIIVIIKARDLHQPTLWNIAFMAAWDLALGLHVLVFIVPSKAINAAFYPNNAGKILTRLLMFIVTQNAINIIIALVDRYISICWPLHYQRLMSPKRFACAVTSGFLINVLRVCILLTQTDDGVYDKNLGIFASSDRNLRMLISGGLAVTALSIIIGLLIRIRLELGRNRSHDGTQQSMSTQFTFTMYVSTLVYILCFMPSVISVLVDFITQKHGDVTLQIGMSAILSNSLWNVFIYAITYRPFRDAFMKVFCASYTRKRARREMQVNFQRNRVNVFTIGEGQ